MGFCTGLASSPSWEIIRGQQKDTDMNDEQAKAVIDALNKIAKSLENIDKTMEQRLKQIALKQSR